MPAHFTIYKVQPSSGMKVVLHEKIPEQLVEWLCKMCDLEMNSADRAHGYVIEKQSQANPVKLEFAPHARTSAKAS
jgi:hypothetical protein